MDTLRRNDCKPLHITTSTTTTPWSSTVRLLSLVVCVTNAGTSWTITVKNKEGTAKIVYSATAALGTVTPLALTDEGGIDMEGGIDIVTAGTAGVVDIWATATRYDGF